MSYSYRSSPGAAWSMYKNPIDKYNIAAFGYKKRRIRERILLSQAAVFAAAEKKNSARFTPKDKLISPRVSDRDRRPAGHFMIIAHGLEIILWQSSSRHCHL
jgi:hypothetical protein